MLYAGYILSLTHLTFMFSNGAYIKPISSFVFRLIHTKFIAQGCIPSSYLHFFLIFFTSRYLIQSPYVLAKFCFIYYWDICPRILIPYIVYEHWFLSFLLPCALLVWEPDVARINSSGIPHCPTICFMTTGHQFPCNLNSLPYLNDCLH